MEAVRAGREASVQRDRWYWIFKKQEFPVVVSDKVGYRAEATGNFQSSALKCKREHYKIVVPSTSEILCIGGIWTTEKQIYRKVVKLSRLIILYLENRLRTCSLSVSKATRSRKGWNV